MSSPAEDKECGVCTRRITSEAVFTAECSHSFHLGCIFDKNSNTSPLSLCPLCYTNWNHLPFYKKPNSDSNVFHTNVYHPLELYYDDDDPFLEASIRESLEFSDDDDDPFLEASMPEPLEFYDDDPLLEPSSASIVVVGGGLLQKVSVEAIPERHAISASEPVSLFTVLLKLKAPPLSADAVSSQRAPIGLVTVLDVSGSMSWNKLSLVKRAVHFVINNLGPYDRLSIVSFSSQARRICRLTRMTDTGRYDAKLAVDSLYASGGTDIVQGLKKGSQVLEERRYENPVTSIIFLSDGNDTCNGGGGGSYFRQNSNFGNGPPEYLNLLPRSIYPGEGGGGPEDMERIPVHSFGFGSDHDSVTMHAISDASGGTFSFIESYEMVQDAFASCIGGLPSVVTQELRLTLRSASDGGEIESIPSGRYASEITDQGSKGTVHVGNLYADEEKEFLINLSIPALPNSEETERKTSILDIVCSYRDVVSKEMVEIESELVEIKRLKAVLPSDMTVNLEVDRQRNRLHAAESIAEAQKMAETGDLLAARTLLAKGRTVILGSASAQAGDVFGTWLEEDMMETERRMGSAQLYQREGRAFALSGMSSHGTQRATTRGKKVAGAGLVENFSCVAALQSAPAFGFDPYSTPSMANMVFKSQQLSKTDDTTTTKEK
ncbi:hypothetical protein MIMGU_mgv1a021543mg [Erythranthe guttata]|uniref:RING-type domain-containing protein n=1 Tax=Erythranthe guttata TaxID=4155 RepID=A0A022RL93_ERYGU|nr:PREDICTED: uncharacterized protein LOC105955337 [Erythranthe guttata]EYU39680.1 hypothetical protein MIMGU_mgv1a021543mg [Erythranthe guttata]|eukprot:XP_012834507.1 PREDICTED: uncharacterized protein LOC105955337 [Erythranthe guttata]